MLFENSPWHHQQLKCIKLVSSYLIEHSFYEKKQIIASWKTTRFRTHVSWIFNSFWCSELYPRLRNSLYMTRYKSALRRSCLLVELTGVSALHYADEGGCSWTVPCLSHVSLSMTAPSSLLSFHRLRPLYVTSHFKALATDFKRRTTHELCLGFHGIYVCYGLMVAHEFWWLIRS